VSNDDSEKGASPPAVQEVESAPKLSIKRVLVIAFAIVAFAVPLGRRIYRDGGSASMIFFLVVPAVVLFLILAPRKFGLGEKPRFDFTVGSAERSPTEGNAQDSKWRR
jgi:hypothetical protein